MRLLLSSSRLAALLGVLFLAAAPTGAQGLTLCQGGSAGGYACDGVDLYAHIPLADFASPGSSAPTSGNEIWGWTDPETGREYALVGLSNGTAFVDVTVPDAPLFVGKLKQPAGVSSSLWRTLRVYADHVFVGSEASGHGVQVFDLTRLRSVTNPPQTFTEDALYTANGNAHTLVIDEATGFLYIAGSFGYRQCNGGGLHIVDVRNPLTPTFAGCFDEDGYTHEAQCLTYDGPDSDYQGRELCVAYNTDHVAFVDVTDKANPMLISQGFYPNPGYTHQGWFTDDKRHLLIDDELDDFVTPTTRTLIMDVADLDDPEFAFSFLGTTAATDHNQYVRDGYAFQSNYNAGLRILDLSGIDEGALTEVAYFDTYRQNNGEGFSGQWMSYPYFASGTVVANDITEGFFALRVPLLPTNAAVAPDIEPVGGPPVVVPPSGGLVRYTLSFTNTTDSQQAFDFWLVLDFPSGAERTLLSRTLTVGPNQTAGPFNLSLNVPGRSPAGPYTLTLNVGALPATVEASDSFTFEKQAPSGLASGASSAEPFLVSEGAFADAAATSLAGTSPAGLEAYPNPSRGQTSIRFTLAEVGPIRLAVYDMLGREVAVLAEGEHAAGPHAAVLDGAALPAGLYLVRLDGAGRSETRRFSLVR